MQSPENALIIFVRNPVLGKVKTRLAKDAGQQGALEIYIKLLKHTKEIALAANADCFIFYADYLNEDDLWEEKHFKKYLQQNGDLGHRMHNAFNIVFSEGYKKACIIGSDCAELSTKIIDQAFTELERQEVVIGPSLDGGYYLLGMNKIQPKLFSAKKWSTESVFSSTLADVNSLNLSYSLLAQLSDIDYLEDWERYQSTTRS